MKFCVVSDIHLDSRTPVARKDDFRSVILDKVRQVSEIAEGQFCDFIIHCGDLFNRPSVPLSFVGDCITVFQDCFSDTPFYSIIGNHDAKFAMIDRYYHSSPISVLFKSGVAYNPVEDFPHNTDEVEFHFFHFQKEVDIPLAPDNGKTNILISHQYRKPIFDQEQEVIPKDVQESYQMILNGHDHSEVLIEEEDHIFLQPGSLSRLTSHIDDQNRDVKCWTVEIIDGGVDIESHELDIPDLQSAYDTHFLEKKLEKKELEDFVESLNKKGTQEDDDILSILDSLCESKDVKDICIEYMKSEHIL